MYQIQTLTDNSLQTQNLILADGSSLTLTIYFMPMQYSWFINNLTYGNFILKGYKIVNSGNLLYQFKNLIPFGLACFSNASRDPSLQEDFSSGYSSLYILSSTEVAQYAEILSGQISA